MDEKCTRIWWVRPVSRLIDASVASPKRSITSQWVTASLPAGVTVKRKSETFCPPDRSFDGGLVFLEIALHERMVGLLHLMLGELPAHLLVGEVGFAYEHEP